MQRIIVLNPKGGSGKTTVATNLASYYASQGKKTTLIDHDSQGSTTYWVEKRGDDLPAIQCISAYKQVQGVTRSWAMRTDPDVEKIILDTPAALDIGGFSDQLHKADAILIPVLPSEIDIRAVADCVANLLLRAKIRCREERIGVVANRAKVNTRVYKKLVSFLESLSIPFITTLRDSQNYVRCAEEGLGLFELKAESRITPDLESWLPIIEWVESRPGMGAGGDQPGWQDRPVTRVTVS